MCIVIDTNALSKVFKDSDAQHSEFRPVLEWIRDGKGKLVVGGTTFYRELFEDVQWFTKVFRILRQVGKIVEVDSDRVDSQEKWVKTKVKDDDFDDAHIVALIGSSGCRLVCTGDKRSFPFLTNKALYPKRKSPPAIYQKARNRDLLNDGYIADCCLPSLKLAKATKAQLSGEST